MWMFLLLSQGAVSSTEIKTKNIIPCARWHFLVNHHIRIIMKHTSAVLFYFVHILLYSLKVIGCIWLELIFTETPNIGNSEMEHAANGMKITPCPYHLEIFISLIWKETEVLQFLFALFFAFPPSGYDMHLLNHVKSACTSQTYLNMHDYVT